MSSPEAFVWTVLHFYQRLLEPVGPTRSGCACTQARLRRMAVGHRGQRSTRAVPHSLFIIFTAFFFCFLSAHLLFIRQLHRLDFPQTSATSGHHANSASGLLLNRLPSDNRFHVEAATEKIPSKQAAYEASKQGENAEMAL